MFSVTHLGVGYGALIFVQKNRQKKISVLCIPQKWNEGKTKKWTKCKNFVKERNAKILKKNEMQKFWIEFDIIKLRIEILYSFVMSQISDTGNITSSSYITGFWCVNTSVDLKPPWKLSYAILPSVHLSVHFSLYSSLIFLPRVLEVFVSLCVLREKVFHARSWYEYKICFPFQWIFLVLFPTS